MTTALGNVVFVRNAHIKDMYNIEVEVVNSSKPSDEVVKEAMAGEIGNLTYENVTCEEGTPLLQDFRTFKE